MIVTISKKGIYYSGKNDSLPTKMFSEMGDMTVIEYIQLLNNIMKNQSN